MLDILQFELAAPFAACVVLVLMLGYLGLHVLLRKVIFVDLALAQIAAFGGRGGVLLRVSTRERALVRLRSRRGDRGRGDLRLDPECARSAGAAGGADRHHVRDRLGGDDPGGRSGAGGRRAHQGAAGWGPALGELEAGGRQRPRLHASSARSTTAFGGASA